MIGIVIVSHSAKLAEGVVELAREMGGDDLAIQAVGGLNTPDRELGTDPMMIVEAIEKVFSPDGVLVLMDLGSALLSAEMALELLPAEKAAKVHLCDAPLVEGAIAAAVQARLNVPIEQVIQEAKGALQAKVDHIDGEAVAPQAAEQPIAGEKSELRLKVNNRLGLHARPAARFVRVAGGFPDTDVQVQNLSSGRGPVNAKSINAVTTLGVGSGDEILITAAGAQAQAALQAFRDLAAQNFGDDETAPEVPAKPALPNEKPAKATDYLQGIPVSRGIAIGPLIPFQLEIPEIPTTPAKDPQQEWEGLRRSLAATRRQIQADFKAASQRIDAYTAAIFEAHLLFLDDEALLEPARSAIFDEHLNAAQAWMQAVERIAADYRNLEDAYLQARAKDVEDVGRQVLVNLLGGSLAMPPIEQPGILVAPDLTPAETTHLDAGKVRGILTAYGGPTSHAAILARALDIPAIAGLGEAITALPPNTLLVMDGEAGRVWVDPSEATIGEYRQLAQEAEEAKTRAYAESRKPAVTLDGHQIEVAANVGSASEAQVAVAAGAEGVGLFRTEFLFLDRQDEPDEEEQVAAYRAVAQALEGRPLIIRTLDAGGDKPLPYLNLAHEANPFMGLRALRISLQNPALFKTQLRAIARVAADFPVKIMFPMVATLSEWRQAKALLGDAIGEVGQSGHAAPERIETGIMVEIPAAALLAAQFAAEVDFFSIGTNDLTQYSMAAERGNSSVQHLADALHPAVLQLIERVVQAAHAEGKWVGVCGELAGDPQAVALLVGLGVDELSMSAPAIPEAKQIIGRLALEQMKPLAQSALALEDGAAVRKLLEGLPGK